MQTRSLLGCVAAAALGLSCGFNLGDVDRTQPHKVRKSVFTGEWYYRQTVLALPYGTGLTFQGEQNDPADMIRWEVQENYLVAWRATDLVENTDLTADFGGSPAPGVAVAVFPVQSHFDIQREYNAQTGEQTNVISENTTDRPWYDRTWMRVDWSRNLAPSFSFLTGNLPMTPGDSYVQQAGDVDEMVMARRNDNGWEERQGEATASLGQVDYLDMVHRVMVAPETYVVEDEYGDLWEEPACWYYGNIECNPGELRVRSSFLRRVESSYVPRQFPDREILRTADGNPIRVSYADRDSLTPDPDGFVARADYFDKFGYFRTERDVYDRRHGETNEGRLLLINRFNIWENAPGCIGDLSQPAAYANCTVKPIVYYLSPSFPQDMKPAAQETARQWNEAFKKTVRTLKYADNRALDQVEEVFVLKDNTFRVDGDHVADRGQRVGDLRYNMMVWVDEPTQAGLLGYGPSTADPRTGEIINAAAFVYGASVDMLAQRGKDVIDLTNDPSRFNEFIGGEDVQRDVVLRSAEDPNANQRTRQFVRQHMDTDRARAIKQRGLRHLKTDGSGQRARLEAIKDTPLEARLIPDAIIRAMTNTRGGDAGLSDATRSAASPRRWAMGQRQHLEKVRRLRLARGHAEPMNHFDPSVIGLAQAMKDHDPAQVYQDLRVAIFKSTMEHEVGHTLGLRHNFEGTSDALNSPRSYWELRGANPQPMEPLTQEQIDGRMRELQYSSIMDYGSRFMSDIRGIGLYDHAAIAFGYGDLVEVFAAEPNENLLEVAELTEVLRHYRHYTKLPNIFGGVDGMFNRQLVPYQKLVDQLAGRSAWTLWEVPYRFCSDEYDGATATCATYDEGADAHEIAQAAAAQYLEYFPFLSFSRDRRYFNEWDYMDRVYSRTLAPMLTQYQNWVFDRFNYEDTYECLRSEDPDCDYANGSDAAYYDIADTPWTQSADGGLSGASATRQLLDLLAAMVAEPEPGSYVMDPAEQTLVLYTYEDIPRCTTPGGTDCSDANVPLGTGRYTDSLWDYDSGYYFYDRLQMVGSFYDKLLAVETAVTADTYFVGVDTGSDIARYLIGLNLYFPEEIYRLLGGAAAEDYPVIAGVVCNSDGSYHPPSLTGAPAPCDAAGSQFIDPATSFTVELYAIWFGVAFLPMSFDTAFSDRMKIWLEGSGEAFTPAVPSLVETFTNPLNNRIYHATRAPDPNAYSPGASLIRRAQRFADAYTADPSEYNRYALESIVTTLEDVRGTHLLYGTLVF